MPRSRDILTVYNGKGVTREHALVGAVMEAVERQAAGRLTLETVDALPAALLNALDPAELNVLPAWGITFVRGYDVLRDEPAYVPRAAIEWPALGPRIFPVVTTNGLASGNTLLEAMYHALCELVERHVWSVAHARAHLRPHAFLASLAAPGVDLRSVMIDDPIGIALELPTGEAVVDAIHAKIERCGLRVRLLALGEGVLPTTIIATLFDPHAASPMVHIGLGTSWSPVHATVRALTEAVQSRLTDVQGAREDIVRAGDSRPTRFRSHNRRLARLPHGRWTFDGPVAAHGRLREIADRSSNDLAADFRALLDALRASGVRRAIIVDITPPGTPVTVVRAIAPDLESMVTDGRQGRTIRVLLDTQES